MAYKKKAVFKLNYKQLVTMLLPCSLQKPLMRLWLNALIAPIKELYTQFTDYRQQVNYQIEYSGQVVYLQKVLNDCFDDIDRRIRIIDTRYDEIYIHKTSEKKPLSLSRNTETKPLHVLNRSYYVDAKADFQVFIPAEISIWVNTSQEAVFCYLLNYYKLAGTCYELIK